MAVDQKLWCRSNSKKLFIGVHFVMFIQRLIVAIIWMIFLVFPLARVPIDSLDTLTLLSPNDLLGTPCVGGTSD